MKIKDKKQLYVRFGSWIRDARVREDAPQWEIAERIGISQSYYQSIEVGGRNVSLPLAINICAALGLNLNDFISSLSKRKPKVDRPEHKQ